MENSGYTIEIVARTDGNTWQAIDDRQAQLNAALVKENSGEPLRINSQEEMTALSELLGTRGDWNEPDEQEVDAVVYGRTFDNAGFWPLRPGREGITEMYISLMWNRDVVAYVNLANLFSWATL